MRNFVAQPAVIGVNGAAKSSFGGTPLAKPLQNSLHVADAKRLVDIFDHGQRFVVGENRLLRRKTDEAGFQYVEG